jgi:hypothetical protein
LLGVDLGYRRRFLATWEPLIGAEAAVLNYRRRRWQLLYSLFLVGAVIAAFLSFGVFDQPSIYGGYLVFFIVAVPVHLVVLGRKKRLAWQAADRYLQLPHVPNYPPRLRSPEEFNRWRLGRRRLGLKPRTWSEIQAQRSTQRSDSE